MTKPASAPISPPESSVVLAIKRALAQDQAALDSQQLDAEAKRAQIATRRLARIRMGICVGMTQADIAAVLGVSKQRVNELLAAHARSTATETPTNPHQTKEPTS